MFRVDDSRIVLLRTGIPDMNSRNLSELKVSVIIVTNSDQRLLKLKESLNALENQTYRQVEVVVVGNGLSESACAYLFQWASGSKNRQFLPFRDNAWSYLDHSIVGRLRYEAGIQHAKGDLIFCQSDDDFVAPDFFERMVNLFAQNADCMTAIGLPLSYFWDTDRIELPKEGTWRDRPRYMHGKDLVMSWIKDNSFHPNPGFCFVCRKALFVEAGSSIWYGYDTSILLSLVPQGITGFDPDAFMYWGCHDDQAHIELNEMHYEKFVYVEQFRRRDQLASDIWNEIGSIDELRTLRTFQKSELAYHSARGVFQALKRRHLRLALKHLRVGGFLRVMMIGLKEMKVTIRRC